MPAAGQVGTDASDSALTAHARWGDVGAFDLIVRQQRADLLSHALRRLQNREAALDCVQETFLRAWESLPRFRAGCSLQTWLHRILENVCLEERCMRARNRKRVGR